MSDDLESQDRTGGPTQTALSLREAAELVGKDRTTLQKALRRKGISTHQDESGKHWIEPSELFRVYPHAQHAHVHSGERSQKSTSLHSAVHTVHEEDVHATAEVGRFRDELAVSAKSAAASASSSRSISTTSGGGWRPPRRSAVIAPDAYVAAGRLACTALFSGVAALLNPMPIRDEPC